MKFIIKLFPEITIKSQSVRLRFIKILTGNIRNVLKHYDETLAVVRHWDNIEVRAKDENQRLTIRDALTPYSGYPPYSRSRRRAVYRHARYF